MRFPVNSIRSQLEASILLTTAAVLFCAYCILMAYEWYSSERETVAAIETEAKIIADNSTAAMAFNVKDDAMSVLMSAQRDTRVLAAALYRIDGSVLASFSNEEDLSLIPVQAPQARSFIEDGLLTIRHPVQEGTGERLGQLVLIASLASRSEKFVHYGVLMACVFGIGFVLATVMSTLLKRKIAKPVDDLTRAVERVAREGDFSVRVPAGGANEVSILADSFNRMIYEIQQRDKALKTREQEFRALVEQAPDVITRYDPYGRILYISPAIERLTGKKRSFYIGKLIEELDIPPDQKRGWRESVSRVFETGKPTLLETEMSTENDAFASIHARLVPEFGEEGRVCSVLSISRDITERKKVEEVLRAAKERAEAAARTKSVFLANMSHDIRTPLTSIIGFAEILSERLPPEERELSDMIREGGRRLLETLNSVLDLARLEGGAELKRTRVDVGAEVVSIARLFQPRAQEKGLEFSYDVPSYPVYALIDTAAFGRVLINLVGNAMKFTAQGNIHVALTVVGDELTISVSDTGPGISEDFLPHLFDAFTRGRTSEAERVEGSGLGLTITKQLSDLLGGRLNVTSQMGCGSTFSFSVPRMEGEPAQILSRPAVSLSRKSILVAEDNPNIQSLIRVLLCDRYQIKICERSDETIEAAEKQHFDLVLLDIGLESSEAGIECLRRLRQIDGYMDIPIIAFTAHAMPEETGRFRRLGFDDLLQKPFAARQLNELLGKFLSDKELQAEASHLN